MERSSDFTLPLKASTRSCRDFSSVGRSRHTWAACFSFAGALANFRDAILAIPLANFLDGILLCDLGNLLEGIFLLVVENFLEGIFAIKLTKNWDHEKRLATQGAASLFSNRNAVGRH
jgi:hypothetical protein